MLTAPAPRHKPSWARRLNSLFAIDLQNTDAVKEFGGAYGKIHLVSSVPFRLTQSQQRNDSADSA